MRKILLSMLILFNISLYAADVSNFDIKGIKLGMNEEEVLKKIPCHTPFKAIWYVDEKNKKYPYHTFYNCEKGESSISVTLDYNLKVSSVSRNIKFQYTPDFKKLEKETLSHYGHADKRKNEQLNGGNIVSLCWGECKAKKKQLKVSLINLEREKTITFSLRNYTQEGKNSRYREKMEKQLKDEISNIDF